MQTEQNDNGHHTPRTHRGGARWFFVVTITAFAMATAAVVGHALASGDGYKSEYRWGHHGGRGPAVILFQQLDADGDGALTETELRSGVATRIEQNDNDNNGALTLEEFEGVWMEFMRTTMVRAFQRLDEDGDAQITQAELDERVDWMLSRLDRNGDGAITRKEVKRRGHHD